MCFNLVPLRNTTNIELKGALSLTTTHGVLYLSMLCFSYYNCAYNRLPLGPLSLLRHTLLSCTDYDSSLIPIVTHTSTPTSSIWLVTWTDSLLVLLLVVSVAFQVPVLVVSAWCLAVLKLYQ
jgi:hypothetical protein